MRSSIDIAPIGRERVLSSVPDMELCEDCLSLLDNDPLHAALVLPDGHIIPFRFAYIDEVGKSPIEGRFLGIYADWYTSLCRVNTVYKSRSFYELAPPKYLYSHHSLQDWSTRNSIIKVLEGLGGYDGRILSVSNLPCEFLSDLLIEALLLQL
jgi:hypothetical protein